MVLSIERERRFGAPAVESGSRSAGWAVWVGGSDPSSWLVVDSPLLLFFPRDDCLKHFQRADYRFRELDAVAS